MSLLGHHERKGPDLGQALANVSIGNVRGHGQKREKESPRDHIPVKEEQGNVKKNVRKRAFHLSGPRLLAVCDNRKINL